MDFVLDKDEAGAMEDGFEIEPPDSGDAPTPPSTRILAASAGPIMNWPSAILNKPVAEAPVALDARLARVEDYCASSMLCRRSQFFYSKADVSFASSFNPRATCRRAR